MQKQLVDALKGIVGPEFVLTDGDEGKNTAVLPSSTEELSKVLALANTEKIPVCPVMPGWSNPAAAEPQADGITLLLKRLNKIVEIDVANLIAIVEPGVLIADLNDAVKSHGLFYPAEPGLFPGATIGGMVADNTAGIRDLKYGAAKHFIMGFEAVLSDGRVIKTGGKNVKDVAGYDMTKLITGSDGTLAVVAKITVKLMPLPESAKIIVASYKTAADAGKSVSELLAAKLTPTVLEFLDNTTAATLENNSPAGLSADYEATLLLEVDGIADVVRKESEKIVNILKAGAAQVIELDAPEARSKVWDSLHSTLPALAGLNMTTIEEFSLPAGKVSAMVQAVKEKAAAKNLPVACFGHAGAGNLYAAVALSSNEPDQFSTLQSLREELAATARQLNGAYIDRSFVSPVMKAVKKALDPNDILNPGKFGKGV